MIQRRKQFFAPHRNLGISCSHCRCVQRCAAAVELRVATFKVDVTPPIGSPLCDALVPPATGVNDPLSARGIVLKADDQKPVVLVAVDWVGIGNEGHDAWRNAIAEACDTTPDRVCVHACISTMRPVAIFWPSRSPPRRGCPANCSPSSTAREAIRRVGRRGRRRDWRNWNR